MENIYQQKEELYILYTTPRQNSEGDYFFICRSSMSSNSFHKYLTIGEGGFDTHVFQGGCNLHKETLLEEPFEILNSENIALRISQLYLKLNKTKGLFITRPSCAGNHPVNCEFGNAGYNIADDQQEETKMSLDGNKILDELVNEIIK